MAKHDIYLTIPPKTVLNKDTEFEVHSDEAMLGTLLVSKGTIEWRPANYISGYHLSWEDFNRIMQEKGCR